MKEQIKQIIASAPDRLRARNLVREYCQARILQFLQEAGAFGSWIFHGGTALRFLYMLPRYSEDLDFALTIPSAAPDFVSIITDVGRSFEAEAYEVDSRIDDQKTVKSAFIRFPGLLYELGLSPPRTEVLSIKVEVDSHPPAGGIAETSIIRRYVLLNVLHYDKASFLSGKLHAIIMRSYLKGRDLYDLFWYMSDTSWPEPNYRILNEALRQTEWKGSEINRTNWVSLVAKRLENVRLAKGGGRCPAFCRKATRLCLADQRKYVKVSRSETISSLELIPSRMRRPEAANNVNSKGRAVENKRLLRHRARSTGSLRTRRAAVLPPGCRLHHE